MPAPSVDTTPPTKPGKPKAEVTDGKITFSFPGSTDDNPTPVAGYQLTNSGKVIATVDGTTIKVPASVIPRPGKLVLQLQAVDSAGNLSDPVTITLTRAAAPQAMPKTPVPGWAWKLAAWQGAPKATRGARPQTPKTVPAWYGKWNAWHKAPVTVTTS
jgi:hypothetical protein